MTNDLQSTQTNGGVVYTLHCRSDSGVPYKFFYNPHSSEFVDEDGRALIADAQQRTFPEISRIGPETPGLKSRSPYSLKIQLGLQCNYSCSYCNQASEIEAATVTRTADVDRFLPELDSALQGAPEEIEFWGGEPFLYFAKLKRLIPPLREKFPNARFSIVTNGSLIDDEIIAFVECYDIQITISHDGPGQHLRGPDPFDDPVRAGWIKKLWQVRHAQGKIGFNIVFSPANCDVVETHAWFAEKLGSTDVKLWTEGALSVYQDRGPEKKTAFSAEHYRTLRESIVDFLSASRAQVGNRSIADKAEDFLDSLYFKRPASALGQKCSMDRPDQLAVDLGGNVLTCHNTGAAKHRIGSLTDLDSVRLDTAWHWSHRESCNYCPVLQLCKGGCMYLDDTLFAETCENEYRYNEAILAGTIKRITSLNLERIEGDIRRPKHQRAIPIKLVSA